MIDEIIDLVTTLMKTPNSVFKIKSIYFSASYNIYHPVCRVWQNLTRSRMCRARPSHVHCMQYDLLDWKSCMHAVQKYNFLNGEPKQPYKKCSQDFFCKLMLWSWKKPVFVWNDHFEELFSTPLEVSKITYSWVFLLFTDNQRTDKLLHCVHQ